MKSRKPQQPPEPEPEIQVTLRLEEIPDDDRAADLYGTILRSVRAAQARREREQKHNGNAGDQSKPAA
jgi:hypothetical protein